MRLRTLRGRLVTAMLAILALALGLSAAVDAVSVAQHYPAVNEPFQDAMVLAGFSLPALVFVWLISSRSLAPLARMSEQARQVGPRNPAARLSATGLPAEIVPLVGAVNGALDRMSEAFEAERRFTEYAAHELRTPLAVLGLRLQTARQQAATDWAGIDRDLAHMNRLVSQMLDLARKEHAGRIRSEGALRMVNVARIAREACAMIVPLAEARGRQVVVTGVEVLEVAGDADDLRDAIRNLLENALAHGSGQIGLDARADPTRGGVVICVSDEGPGMAPRDVQAAFDRFHKGVGSAGVGLGLAIVREVVRSHRGYITFLPGNGCHVEVRF